MDSGASHVERAVADATALLTPPETKRLTVVVNDPQRHTNTMAVLSALAGHVCAGGVRILVATGSHAFGPERREVFERSLIAGLGFDPVAWHDCRDPDLRPVAPGAWRSHPWLTDSSALLAVGSVEPHYFAGFTGAHKTLTIGCASYEDIQRNHAAAVSDQCRPARLEGNPIFEGVAQMLSALSRRSALAAVNLVQSGGRILAAAGGEPIETLHRLRGVVEETFIRRIKSPVDAVVAEVAGPLGRSFYQADKGIKNCEHAVRDGGVIVLVAPCPDGIGQGAFTDLMRLGGGCREVAEAIERQGYHLGDHKALRLRRLTDRTHRGVRVYVVSDGLSADDANLLGLLKAATVDDALRDASVSRDADSVIHLYDAGNTCLLLEDD